MIGADSLSRRSGALTNQYIRVAALLLHFDMTQRPSAYTGNLENTPHATKIPTNTEIPAVAITTLTDAIINASKITADKNSNGQVHNTMPQLSSVPIMLH